MNALPGRILRGLTVVTAVALLAAGCSSAAPEATTSADTGSTVDAEVQERLAAAMEPIDEFTAPGPEIDASQITSGTVYVIVPAMEVEDFAAIVTTSTEIFSKLGVDVKSCGTFGGSPDGVANCLQQAIDGKAIGIITVGITGQTAPAALAAVADAGIPLVNALTTSTGDGDPALVSYVAPDFIGLTSWLTDWTIDQTGGTSSILALRSTDSDITPAWIDEGVLGTVDASCPECSTAVIDVNVANADKIATQVTAEFVANPDISFTVAGTNNFVADVVTGAQAAGRTSADTAVGTVGSSVAVMQQLADGQWVTAVAGFSIPAIAWYSSDSLIRLILEQPLDTELDFPFQRLFTKDMVGGFELDQAAWTDGSWFGDADYEAGFLTLWGLS